MNVITLSATTKLMNLAATIGRSPQSWLGWHCMKITFDNINENLQHECLFWVRSYLESYLKDIHGRVYFCEDSSIHILCKNVSLEIFEQAGQHICDLALSESSIQVKYKIYNLHKQGCAYANDVLDEGQNLLNTALIFDKSDIENLFTPDESFKQSLSLNGSQNKSRVLLVEDDPVTRWMVRNTLKDTCEFTTAPTANKVFSIYAAYQPDLVFLDINLPDKSGYDVLDWIMNHDPGARVVMFSSNDGLDNIMTALENGASGFISKPFVKNQLIGYISGRH